MTLPATPANPTQNSESSFPGPATATLVSAPPKSIVTSLGMGTQADSRNIRMKIAT